MSGSMSRSARVVAVVVAVGLACPMDAWAERRGSRGSVRGVNRNPGGGSWSGPRSSGSTSAARTDNSATRTTNVQGRRGQSATGTRNVSRDGDTINVDRNVQTSSGASVDRSKEYKVDDGRVQSVERDVDVRSRTGQTASWEGKAEREGAGWEFEGEGRNRDGQRVGVEGYAGRGPYGSGVVADVQGGRYGDRRVGAYRPYGRPGYVTTLPAGHRPYDYYGRPYYGYGGVYYRPWAGGYYVVPPPWGHCCYHDDDMVAAFALTVAGAALLYSDGVYYEKTYVQGEQQYKVVAPPAGATLPQAQVPADAPVVTVSGTTYYLYSNTFYSITVSGGQKTFVVVAKPAGVTSLAALPADVSAQPVGNITYLVAAGRYYQPYLDPTGREEYVLVDPPGAARPVDAKTVPLGVPAGTSLSVRLASEVSSATSKTGARFKANLDSDLVVGGLLVAARGTPVYGRVAEAVAGTGAGQAPRLDLELTDIEVGGKVHPIPSDRVQAQGQGKRPARKVLGTAAMGAGIGAAIDGGEGAAWGAAAGVVVGAAAAAGSQGNQVAFAAGTVLQFHLLQAVTLERAVAVN